MTSITTGSGSPLSFMMAAAALNVKPAGKTAAHRSRRRSASGSSS
jgi:hypothetical protein